MGFFHRITFRIVRVNVIHVSIGLQPLFLTNEFCLNLQNFKLIHYAHQIKPYQHILLYPQFTRPGLHKYHQVPELLKKKIQHQNHLSDSVHMNISHLSSTVIKGSKVYSMY